MDNEQLFDILDKLLYELEYYGAEDIAIRHYCSNIRNDLFTEDNQLTFDVVAK